MNSVQKEIILKHDIRQQSLYRRSLRVLEHYLPDVVQESRQSGRDPRIICDYLAFENREAEENRPIISGLYGRDIKWIYDSILTAADPQSSSQDILGPIYHYMEDSCRDVFPAMRPGGTRNLEQAQRCFRAVAAVSAQAGSVVLGDMLHSFFTTHANRLLDEFQPQNAIVWAYSIYQSCMHPRDKQECLQIIAYRVPQIGQALQQGMHPRLQGLGIALEGADDSYYRHDPYRDRYPRRRLDPMRIGYRSRSPSPLRSRRWLSVGDKYDRRRTSSAPGRHRVALQADRVMDAAEDMYAQADRLKRIAYNDG